MQPSKPDNLVSFQSSGGDPDGPVRAVATSKEWVHALYPNNATDAAQQLGMMVAYQQRAQQSQPVILGQMMFFDLNTPLYGNGKQNCGGPVLGWPDFPVVQATGAEHYRYYTKDTIGKEINVETITPAVMAKLKAEGDRVKASLPPGDDRRVVVALKASSDKFKEHYPGRTE